jgi:hypothetical protein
MHRLVSEFVRFLKGCPPASRAGRICGGVERLESRQMLTLLIDGSQTLVPSLEGSFSIQFENDLLPPADPDAPLIERIIGQQRFAPVQLDVINAANATVDETGSLHVTGHDDGLAARQIVNIANRQVSSSESFTSMRGPVFIEIEEVDNLGDGRIVYLGGGGLPYPAYWLEDPSMPVFPDPILANGGFLEGVSPQGTFFGTSGGTLVTGTINGIASPVPGGGGQIGLDITDDNQFLVTTGGIRQFNGASYVSVSLSGWDVLPDGSSVPSDGFKAATIDPQTGLAIFAVQTTDFTTFEDVTAFYDETGTLLGTTPGVFQDFEIWENHVVFAVNSVVDAQLQGVIGVLSDMSTTTVSELTGVAAQIPENGLAGAPAVFLFGGGAETFAAVFETNSPDPPPSLINTILGAAETTPIELTLDNPANATVDGNGVLHVTGSSSGQGARQTVTLSSAAVTAPESFTAINSGQVSIEEVGLLSDGRVVFTGSSGLPNATYWFDDPATPHAADPLLSQSGVVEGITPSGLMFGNSNNALVVGFVGASVMPVQGGALEIGLDMTDDDQFLVTTGTGSIRQFNGTSYVTVSLSSWDVLPDGEMASTVNFLGATIDPRTGNAVFAGQYTDLATFADSTAFYDETGTLLGTTPGIFQDFEIWSGYVAFAVNAVIDSQNDGVIGILTDMSTTTVSALTGTVAPIPENGLAVGDSAVFLAGNHVHVHSTTSPHAATIVVNYDDGSGTETIVSPTGLAGVSHVFPSNGQYSVSVITGGKAAVHSVTVQSVLTQTVDSVTKSTIGLATSGGSLTISNALISGVDIEVAGQTFNAAPDTIRVIGQSGNDRIRSLVDLPIEISTGDGRDRISLHQSSSDVIVDSGDGNDRVFNYGDGNSQISTGAGNDRVRVRGDGTHLIDSGAGNDLLFVFGGSSTVSGGSGNDRIFSNGTGNYRIDGGDGNDRLRTSGTGQVQLIGGAGSDRVLTSSLSTAIVSLGVGADRGSFSGKTIFVTGTLDDDQTLIDALFVELSNATPNASTLSNLLDGRVTSDTDEDTVNAPMKWGVWDNDDQITGEPTRLN